MFYGEPIEISTEGIRIPPSAVFPIGVGNKSRCWGIWLPANNGPLNTTAFDHLILSPVPPDAWPACYRLQVKLRDAIGCLEAATAQLASENVNVLATDCAPAGFSHAIWNVLCEDVGLRVAAAAARREAYAHQAPSREALNALILRYGIRLFLRMRKVQWILRSVGVEDVRCVMQPTFGPTSLDSLSRQANELQVEIDSRRPIQHDRLMRGFLDGRFVFGQRLLLAWDDRTIEGAAEDKGLLEEIETLGNDLPILCDRGKQIDRSEFADATIPERVKLVAEMMRLDFLKHTAQAVEGNLCPTLLGTWWRRKIGDPIIEYEYCEEDRILRTIREEGEADRHPGVDPPLKATASFSVREGYVRVMPLYPRLRKRRFSIQLEHTVAYDPSTGEDRSSAGLLQRVLRQLRKHEVNLLRLESRLTFRPPRRTRRSERGRMSITGLAPADSDLADLMRRVKSDLETIEDLDRSGIRVEISASVTRESVHRLFVSTRFETQFWRKDHHRRRLRELAAQFGFAVPDTWDDPTSRPITEAVVSTLQDCSAFMQILPLDPREEIEQVDLTWPTAELLAAMALSIPIRRSAQRRCPDDPDAQNDWRRKLKLDADRYLDTWWDDELFERTLPGQLQRLRDEVDGLVHPQELKDR